MCTYNAVVIFMPSNLLLICAVNHYNVILTYNFLLSKSNTSIKIILSFNIFNSYHLLPFQINISSGFIQSNQFEHYWFILCSLEDLENQGKIPGKEISI